LAGISLSSAAKTLLLRLEATLFGAGQFVKAAVNGLGGIGKTQLVLELAYRTNERCPDCSVFWQPAMSLNTVERGVP
jgi:hypothetical protein